MRKALIGGIVALLGFCLEFSDRCCTLTEVEQKSGRAAVLAKISEDDNMLYNPILMTIFAGRLIADRAYSHAHPGNPDQEDYTNKR